MPRHAFVLAGVCALTFFAGLGRPALTDSDEAFYAQSAREMIERGDWLTPYYNGEPRFDKPVLYYWLAAVSYAAAGVSPGAARFPSAAAGAGLVLVTFLCARRWCGEPTARLAGLIAATSAGMVAAARQALPDLPLAFFVTLSTWAALVALLDDAPAPAPRARRGWLLLVALGAAGAFLVKGPVGPALVAAAVLPAAVLERRRRGALPRVPAADLALAAAVFLLAALPWYAAMAAEHGAGYLERFFFAENLERFATDRYNAPRPAWYYLPILAGGLLPWSPFLILWAPALPRLVRRRGALDASVLRLVVWAAAPLAVLTLSVGKQPRYVLPLLTPLAILLARSMVRALDGSPAARGTFAAAGAAAAAVVAAMGVLLYRARPLLVEWSPTVTLGVPAAVLLAGAAIAVAALAAWRRPRIAGSLPAVVAAAGIVLALGAHLAVLASPGPASVERVAALLSAARGGGEAWGRHRVFDRNLVYYAGAPHVALWTPEATRDFLESSARVLCVLREEDAARFERNGLRLRRLGAVRYLNTGNLNLRTLLDPDPERYLQRVVLVANRQESAP